MKQSLIKYCPGNGHESHFVKTYKGTPIRHCISYQVQSGACMYPDVLPPCIPPVYIQSGASILPDVFPAHVPTCDQAHLVQMGQANIGQMRTYS